MFHITNSSKPVALKNQKLELFIREHLNKPTGEITVSDLQKIKLLAVLANRGIIFHSQNEIHPDYEEYVQSIEDEILKNGNRIALKLYTNFEEGNDKYRRIFGFCFLLGLKNIYDIGCGTGMQVGSIVKYQDIAYTGIDCFDMLEIDPSDNNTTQMIPMKMYNQLFNGYNDKIRFYKGKYPLHIQSEEDAIAILLGWVPDVQTDLPQILTKDFKRILLQTELSDLSAWQNVLAQYELYPVYTYTWEHCFTGKLNGYTYLYASKYPEDIECLKKSDYDYNDSRFVLGHVDMIDFLKRNKKW